MISDLQTAEAPKTNQVEMARGKIVGRMKTPTTTKYRIGERAYIVEYCPEPTLEQADAPDFDVIEWQRDKTGETVFLTLVKAVAFARKAVKTSCFGFVEIYEAEFTNPYRDEFPDWRVKYSALRWKKIEGGYECEINR